MLELKQIESFYPERLRSFKKNLLREYLQYKILEIIFSSEFAGKLCFMGGTALHLVHGLPRFSEDLDFDNRGLNRKSFIRLTGLIREKLERQGYKLETNISFGGAYRAYIRISDILYDNKLSAHREEKMLIQIDAEPQNFMYHPDKIIINKFDVFGRINVVPQAVLLSQKIYAIFMRPRPLGRDYYDAIFLFGKTAPNFDYLKLKLKMENISDLKERFAKERSRFDFKKLADDVRHLLYIPDDSRKVMLFNDFIEGLGKAPLP
jgi:predicted nucleotidyltransferase component of viral defense system